jgi:hypothetical protein
MDTLHSVLRSIRDSKARKDHLDVFREFLGHLDRISKRAQLRPSQPKKRGRPAPRRSRKG